MKESLRPQSGHSQRAIDQHENNSDSPSEKNGYEAEKSGAIPVTGTAQRRIDPELERRVVRKLDWHIPPLVAFLFLLSFLDRSNIGNAEIAGMQQDLKLTSDRYAWLLTIFYISYIVFQFQAFMWKIFSPHHWACFIIFAWGIVATCQSATQSWQGMMVCRFLLGAAESGFGPSIPFLLSFFYLRHELGFRSGIFLAAAPLASCFAGALAYGITRETSSFAPWRLLFLVEGIPSIMAAPIAFFFLPDSPAKARFLTAEEKEVARARAIRAKGTEEENKGHSINFKEIGQTLLDVKAWITALMYFSCNVSYASLPVFLPTIINQMGFTTIDSQGLSAPPYFLSVIVTVTTTWIADRTGQRGLMIAALSLTACVGYVLLAAVPTVGVRYFGCFLAASGVFPAIANILPWVINNQGSSSRRGMGIVILNSIGQVGPILGTRVYPSSQAPRYIEGQSIAAAFMFFNACLALTLRTILVRENKKLDAQYGSISAQRAAAAREGRVEEVDGGNGEDNYGASFRYVI